MEWTRDIRVISNDEMIIDPFSGHGDTALLMSMRHSQSASLLALPHYSSPCGIRNPLRFLLMYGFRHMLVHRKRHLSK